MLPQRPGRHRRLQPQLHSVVAALLGCAGIPLLGAVGALNRQTDSVHELVATVTGVLGIACIADFLFLIDYAARLLRPVSILARVANPGGDVKWVPGGERE